MTMVYVTVAIFAVAAVFGAINLVRLAASGRAPRVTVYLHGLVAATALVLLVIYAVTNTAAAPIVALILFIIAALGGFLLFAVDVTTKKPPKWLGFIHGAVAVAGFVFLLIFAFAGKGG